MANINTDEHGPLGLEFVWELHRIEITSDFAVDLPQNICSFGQVEGESITCSYHLRWHAILLEDFLKHFVVELAAKNDDAHERMTEVTILGTDHVLT